MTNAENKKIKDWYCTKKRKNVCFKVNLELTIQIYKCVVTVTGHPQKVYLGTAEGHFKQRYYKHKNSFRN